MKKKILLFTLLLNISLAGMSQVNYNALGLRFGGGTFVGGGMGYGAELSYQRGMSDANRLELDLGIKSVAFFKVMSLTGAYHWVWNLSGGLNWFVGPAAQVGYINVLGSSVVMLSAGAQIGLEYDLNEHGVPLLIGLDTRPLFLLNGGNLNLGAGHGFGGALSLRYTF